MSTLVKCHEWNWQTIGLMDNAPTAAYMLLSLLLAMGPKMCGNWGVVWLSLPLRMRQTFIAPSAEVFGYAGALKTGMKGTLEPNQASQSKAFLRKPSGHATKASHVALMCRQCLQS